MADFRMPILGADMKAGELVAWRKQPGDRVEKGEIIAEVETDKALVEIESMYTGVVEKLLVERGEKVPVGTVLAVIEAEEGEEEAPAPTAAPAAAPPPTPRPGRVARAVRAPSAAGRLRVSPVAQKLADDRGIDLAGVTGSGPGGRIMLHDVEAAIAAAAPKEAAPAPAPAAGAPSDRSLRMRQSIAAAMTRSHQEIPHFYIESVIDMSRAIDWLSQENAEPAGRAAAALRRAAGEGRGPGTEESAGVERESGRKTTSS